MRHLLLSLSMVASLSAWYFLVPQSLGGVYHFGPAPAEGVSIAWWLTLVAGYCCLIIGIVLGVLARVLLREKERGSEKVELRAFVKKSFASIDLWISLIASPVVYGGILRSGTEMSYGAFIYFSLQTGFSSYLAIRSLLPGADPYPSGIGGLNKGSTGPLAPPSQPVPSLEEVRRILGKTQETAAEALRRARGPLTVGS